jgi:hypothetical protein
MFVGVNGFLLGGNEDTSAVSAVYRNIIALNNIDKLQNINGGINEMLTVGKARSLPIDWSTEKMLHLGSLLTLLAIIRTGWKGLSEDKLSLITNVGKVRT